MSARTTILIGQARSGTTWLAKILDAHPDTLYSHEPDSAIHGGIPLLLSIDETEAYRERLVAWVAELRALRTSRVIKLPSLPKSYRGPLGSLAWSVTSVAGKAAPKSFRNASLPRFIPRRELDRITWVWKSIESTGRLGALARIFSDARFIHLVRHPCAVVASVLRGESKGTFTSGVSASEDRDVLQKLTESEVARRRDMTVERLLSMTPIERHAWRWALFHEKAMNDVDGLSNVRTVRYEDLGKAPVPVAKDLLEFSKLPWHDQVETFVKDSTGADDPSYYSVYKDSRQAATKWKRELDEAQIRAILDITTRTRGGELYPDVDS